MAIRSAWSDTVHVEATSVTQISSRINTLNNILIIADTRSGVYFRCAARMIIGGVLRWKLVN